jgi:diaminohydroxyphosphoribosylaminopyrimidine deaminase/5-amino-6-(5-phosphoribosylamino)uracil reductase
MVVPMKPELHSGFGMGGRIARTLAREVTPSFREGSDEYWMEQALLESMEAVGIAAPNPAVGCILVQNGREVGRGHTQAWRHEHAERMALRSLAAGADLSQVTAYVTLEPCSHQGFQPPCVDLFLESAIPEIVIAARDTDPRVNGEGIRRLQEAGKRVRVGVLEKEAQAWNAAFFGSRRKKAPVWFAKWARTPGGFLADATGHSQWITNPQSRAYTHWLRQKADAIVVGAGTFLRDRPRLTVRDCAPPHQAEPVRFVLDSRGRLLQVPPEWLEGFEVLVPEEVLGSGTEAVSQSIKPVPDTGEDPWIRLKRALEGHTYSKPLQSVFLEGGPRILREFLARGWIDGVHEFMGPREFETVSEKYRLDWSPSSDWTLVATETFGQDLLQEWRKKG